MRRGIAYVSRSHARPRPQSRAAIQKGKTGTAGKGTNAAGMTARTRDRLDAIATSKEAQRQLNAGSVLDSRPPVPVPILEHIFADSDIYTRPNDTLKSAKHPFVTPQSPFAQSALDIRGLHWAFVNQVYAKRLNSGTKNTQVSTPLLQATYFPPWHPVALARKSRPAVVIGFGAGAPFNGAQIPSELEKLRRGTEKSPNPFHYAVWRLKTQRRVRTAFAKAWLGQKGVDGLYMIVAKKVPSDRLALERDLETLINRVKEADLDWIAPMAKKIDLAQLNDVLVSGHYQPVVPYSKEDWLESMKPQQ